MLEIDPRSGFVHDLRALVALLVILFRDGLEVEAEMLQKGMAAAAAQAGGGDAADGRCIVAVATHALTGLGWTESFPRRRVALADRSGALVLGFVTNPRVPRIVRHSLNLESGMNNGFALPAVLAFSAALERRRAQICRRT